MDLSSEAVKTEPITNMVGDQALEGGDGSFDRGTDELGQGEVGSGKKRKVFPYHITSELRSLYKSGMIGVGIQYSTLIDAACERTGLSRAQVKSWIKRTKYHQKRVVLKHDEGGDGDTYQIPNDNNPYIDNNPLLEEPTDHHPQLYSTTTTTAANRDNTVEQVDTNTANRIVIINEDTSPIQDPPTRQDVIPALERHILTTDLKGTIEHLRSYNSNKRPKQVAMVTEEDLARVSRNEAIFAAVQRDQLHHHHHHHHQSVPPVINTNNPSSIHQPTPTHHHTIPIQTAMLQPVSITPHHSLPSVPPALVMTNGLTPPTKITPTVKDSPAQEATKLFKKIERNFKRLDELGYQGFAFSIHGDDTQLVYSGPIGHCFTPPLISYLRAVIVAANPPPLLSHGGSHMVSILSQTHVSPQSSRQPYMYDTHPSRVQQRTAIYELSEADSVDENGDRDEQNEYEPMDRFNNNNNKAVHVVVTQDPNYLDNNNSD